MLKFSFIYIDIKDRAIAFSALMTKLFKIAWTFQYGIAKPFNEIFDHLSQYSSSSFNNFGSVNDGETEDNEDVS